MKQIGLISVYARCGKVWNQGKSGGKLCLIALFLLCYSMAVKAEDGSRAWLRADSVGTEVVGSRKSATLSIACAELRNYWKGRPVVLQVRTDKVTRSLGRDGYLLFSDEKGVNVVSCGELGILYGTYHLLRLQETGADCSALYVKEKPVYSYRLLNHWDNLDGTVERGYAGRSLWNWEELPAISSSRYQEYARLNASIGINGVVLNNVNASPQILSPDYLVKVQALAQVFRPYGIKVFLSINFSSPAALGGLPTSDPLNKDVQRWWRDKVRDIYRCIPDFGGFLVKANSEGLPGPQDFGRTHADGANMLADALEPFGGIVMWRAFVYNPGDEDRAKQAYSEFMPLDGAFRKNVVIQVKNGPVDFQPREPFSPLFGAMRKTSVMPEFQITQEYLGFSNHVAYLAPLWKECLDADTYQDGAGSTVMRMTATPLFPGAITAIAGVANIGTDTNWCGHPLAQANWYAFGRLAWNPQLTSGEIVEEWIRQTFDMPQDAEQSVKELMLGSREAVVNYMMPLGLHHLFAWGHHYGPEPWCAVPGARPDWMPSYYHKADTFGIGFDRSRSGSNAVSQYHEPLCDLYDGAESCPEDLLLWFHHVTWQHKMRSGRTLWEELCYKYNEGVQSVRDFQRIWDEVEPYVDMERFQDVQKRLRTQSRDAVWWRDACLLYFQQYARRPIPYELERPQHNLEDMMRFQLNIKNFECPPYGFCQ
jgi:alpha-glucuronidase